MAAAHKAQKQNKELRNCIDATRKTRIYRVDTETGKRTLLQSVEPRDKTASTMPIRLAYAE